MVPDGDGGGGFGFDFRFFAAAFLAGDFLGAAFAVAFDVFFAADLAGDFLAAFLVAFFLVAMRDSPLCAVHPALRLPDCSYQCM